MRFHINKKSELTHHAQLREQIIFLISTGELGVGSEMPSVRMLARQLGISFNTVSRVYSELVRAHWLSQRHGAHHMVVERRDFKTADQPIDFDDLIDRATKLAQEHGYTLQQLAERIRTRLLEQPPTHFLVVAPDPGLGKLMSEEIKQKIGFAPPICECQLLQQNPALGIGAVLITPTYLIETLGSVPAHRRMILPVVFSPVEDLIKKVSLLKEPSMIGLVSISGAGMTTLAGMFAGVMDSQHSIHLFLMKTKDAHPETGYEFRRYELDEYETEDILRPPLPRAPSISAGTNGGRHNQTLSAAVPPSALLCIDLLICDSIAYSVLHGPRTLRYQLLSDLSLDRIEAQARILPGPHNKAKTTDPLKPGVDRAHASR